ncbi:Tunicamycin induced [Thalictrum thalictroides]|uniref:Tunicamycin induced n=1 Tax=Thalictrum thalictroides TaxID=46969 RepID=A0A7J6VK99_THATH|nr:Tunicamycin induced [Thalictrum thalictroides]
MSLSLSSRVEHELGAGQPAIARLATIVGLAAAARCGLSAFGFTTSLFEALLHSVLGGKPKEQGSFKLLKAEASAQIFVKMIFGVEKELKEGHQNSTSLILVYVVKQNLDGFY